MDIKVNNLYKSFNEHQVLKNISISFSEGLITCIMGASGVGKTTLAYILMGLEKPDSGIITGIKDKKISAVFQEDRLIEHWDAIRNVMLVCNKDMAIEKVESHFVEIGLTEYKGKPVKALSGGMRRRVAIVRAILSDNDVLLMDEPFKGLDEELKAQVISYVKKHTKGKTLIVITHDKKEVDILGAKLITMY